MVKALRAKQIDVTYRGLAADDIIDLQSRTSKDLQLVDGAGHRHQLSGVQPQGPWAGKTAVRRAVAQLVDRGAITHKIYKDTVDPLYSMVPKGLTGHTTDFFDDFGDPSVARQQRSLSDAHITQRVPLTLWYTNRPLRLRDRPGVQGTQAPARRLRTLLDHPKSRPWKTYVTGYQKGEYPVFGAAGSRLPDAENFIRAVRRSAERARYARTPGTRPSGSPSHTSPGRLFRVIEKSPERRAGA